MQHELGTQLGAGKLDVAGIRTTLTPSVAFWELPDDENGDGGAELPPLFDGLKLGSPDDFMVYVILRVQSCHT